MAVSGEQPHAVSRIIESFAETLKVNELEARIAALETKTQ
jgi:hypothetical protein